MHWYQLTQGVHMYATEFKYSTKIKYHVNQCLLAKIFPQKQANLQNVVSSKTKRPEENQGTKISKHKNVNQQDMVSSK